LNKKKEEEKRREIYFDNQRTRVSEAIFRSTLKTDDKNPFEIFIPRRFIKNDS
jgi:hypothetical protein